MNILVTNILLNHMNTFSLQRSYSVLDTTCCFVHLSQITILWAKRSNPEIRQLHNHKSLSRTFQHEHVFIVNAPYQLQIQRDTKKITEGYKKTPALSDSSFAENLDVHKLQSSISYLFRIYRSNFLNKVLYTPEDMVLEQG